MNRSKKTSQRTRCTEQSNRRGSTLLIVLSLLSLLAFIGMVFYTFANQERSAADFFSEAAKAESDANDDPFPWALQQILVGAPNHLKSSILWSPRRRHSMLSGVVGYDSVPYSGPGVNIIYNAAGLPVPDNNYDGVGDAPASAVEDTLNFVDSMPVWTGAPFGLNEEQLKNVRGLFPEPDVDYTYPDINNLWLAHRGWAIRDNGTTVPAARRYERVPVIIPSFMRPALMKSSTTNGAGGVNTPTDEDWYDHTIGTHGVYSARSFRPSQHHVVGLNAAGAPVRRFLDQNNPADAALIATAGAFPLRPSEDVNPASFGRLGLMTGHDPGTVGGADASNFRLDQDNDGDGIFEGIWLDLGYPAQETPTGDLYATLFSFTIYDLDSLIDLNSHGNISELRRNELVTDQVGGGASGTTPFRLALISASNQALGPHEVSPLWALTPPVGSSLASDAAFSDALRGYGANPSNRLEQANMEWLHLLTGRVDTTDAVWDGRYGDANAIWYHIHHDDGSGGNNGLREIATLPRPGRAGRLVRNSTDPINFGGNLGFDDNQSALFGVAHQRTGVIRGFPHLIDLGGTGLSSAVADPRLPILLKDEPNSPEQWLQYVGYSLTGTPPGGILNERGYLGGRDGDFATTADNLIAFPRLNLGFEDPLEFIMDEEFTIRPDDAGFSSGDLVPAHLSNIDSGSSTTNLSTRLSNLAVSAFRADSDISDRFTTISNSLRAVMHRHDLGFQGKPGAPFVDDDGDGTTDEGDEAGTPGTDDGPRAWAWNADTDGPDTDDDGFPDGDGNLEFPPAYGTLPASGKPYSATDPFRPQVRRLLKSEANETRELLMQLPLSINHILDVNRTAETPPDGTAAFLRYMQNTGLRFRRITEHPLASETVGGTSFAAAMTDVPNIGTPEGTAALRNFPPRTFADREFWARRDRQKLARDIYVLLYTLGSAQLDGSGNVENATASNAGQAVYTFEEMRRMAQFAVNMVDAMDADDVVTAFEYDKDLSDGWGLDDDPFTDTENVVANTAGTEQGMYPLDSPTRGIVFGVEAQQLSFSEALAVRLEDFAKYDGTSDDPTTMFSDASGTAPLADPENDRRDRYVLHLELQNNQPYPIPLSINGVTGTTNGRQAVWQLARVDRTTQHTSSNPNTPSDADQAITLDPIALPTGVDGTTMSFMDGNPDIDSGNRFTVAMATTSNTAGTDGDRTDPLGTGSADLYLQKPMATDFALISPDSPGITTTAGGTPNPNCMLDTIHTSHDGRYTYDDTVTEKGYFLREIPYPMGGTGKTYYGNEKYGFDPADSGAPGTAASGQGFEVVLRRRMNPNLPLAPLSENPWVEIDRIRIEFKDYFNFTPAGGGMFSVANDYSQLTSDERPEVLNGDRVQDTQHPVANTDPMLDDYRYNTIGYALDPTNGGVNDATTAAGGVFNLWQPHFDRDFTSVVDLFQIPLVGPRLLTQRLDRMRYSPAQQVSADVATIDPTGDPDLAGSAVAMFLQPDMLPAATNGANDNAWYRLLQYVEVPSNVNSMLGNYLTRHRLPGKVNLNGLRHIEVYAGLIDDALFADIPPEFNPGTNPALDNDNQYAPFTYASSVRVPYTTASTTPASAPRAASQTGPTAVVDETMTPVAIPGGHKDRWFEFIAERDGATAMFDPVIQGAMTRFWVPGTPNARPFRSPGYRTSGINPLTGSDTNLDDTVLRRFSHDVEDGDNATNRHWQEIGTSTNHTDPPGSISETVSQRERHQLLSKIYNNTTTVSNTFIIYGTAAYFHAVEDASGLVRVGGRMGLDLDGDANETNDAGWEKRAVFIVDRTELLNAYDEGTGTFDWQRLIKYRADLASDSQ